MARIEHVIARNVCELRVDSGYTQVVLAAKMRKFGVRCQPNRIAQIETLRRPVSLLELAGLASVFGVPIARLLAGDDDVDLPLGGTASMTLIRRVLSDGA